MSMSHQAFFKDQSKIQEQLVEAWFIRDFILHATRQGRVPLIGHSDIDLFGFDLILGLEGREELLLVQMKTYGGANSIWDVHKDLLRRGGQVVVVKLDLDAAPDSIKYHALTPEGRNSALGKSPKKPHPDKCGVQKGDLKPVDDLMDLFA